MTFGGVGRRIALGLLAAAALTSCLGRTPKQSYYTLGATTPPVETPIASRPDLGLAIGPIDFPRYLDRPEVVTRDGEHSLVLSNTNRWAGSIKNDFQRVLADQIAGLLGTAEVVTHPNDGRFPIDYRVQIELLAFEGTLGGPVVLRARWVVVAATTARAVVVDQADIREETTGPSYDDLLVAHGRAVQRLAVEIATRIAPLAAPKPAS